MKHRVVGRRLDRTTEHRTAMLRNMVTSLIRHERIVTTTPKAKELKRFADKVITLAKRGSPHHRRLANREVKDVEVLNKLFDAIAGRFKARPGGYTRIVRVGRRVGDNADMSVIELLDRAPAAAEEGGEEQGEKKAAKAKAPKAEKTPKAPKAAKAPKAEKAPKKAASKPKAKAEKKGAEE
jgi:large subunit ribosomal protein L17